MRGIKRLCGFREAQKIATIMRVHNFQAGFACARKSLPPVQPKKGLSSHVIFCGSLCGLLVSQIALSSWNR